MLRFGLDIGRAEHVFYNEPMFELERKWAVFEGSRMLSLLTTTPVQFGWGPGIGIAGVGTIAGRRGEGLASELLHEVLRVADDKDERFALLFAVRPEVYLRSGFEVLDQVVRAGIQTTEGCLEEPILKESDVRKVYDTWSLANPNRLRRDARRWRLWNFNARQAVPFLGGYCCAEGSLVREVITRELAMPWPVEMGSEWFGLMTMAQQMGVPVREPKTELLLMGRRVPGTPSMFMTDQF